MFILVRERFYGRRMSIRIDTIIRVAERNDNDAGVEYTRITINDGEEIDVSDNFVNITILL